MKMPKVFVEYTKILGGLDIVSPAMSISPGKAELAMNYEPGDLGGLRRIDGYERFNGRPSPSDAVYYWCKASFVGAVVATDTITGATSTETGVVIEVGDDWLTFTKASGTFTEDEDFTVGGFVVGTFDGAPDLNGHPDGADNAAALNLAADVYRAGIFKPPGSGPVRGGGKLDGVLYVFRDNALATAGVLWKSTASGWAEVLMFHEISFDTGTGLIKDGDTITQKISGATALVRRVVLESGAWGADAAGRLIISNIHGTFNATNDLMIGTVVQAAASSLATHITIATGGKYSTVNYNFYANPRTYRMYGCGGVNRGFEFDGSVYVPINTGMATDKPNLVTCFQSHLFFAFGGSWQHSGTGTPYSWSPSTGANEVGVGENITALVPVAGKVLAIIGERGSRQLSGTSVLDFEMGMISADVGSIPYATQNLGSDTLMISDHGITRLFASQAYGNFEQGTASQAIQPIVEEIKPKIIGSSVYRSRTQYRAYGSDGSGLIGTSTSEKAGLNWVPAVYFTQFKYPINLNCVIPCDDDTTYLCDDEGMVYQADKGTSFDGEDIEAYFRTAFNHMKAPTTLKSFLKASFEMTVEGYSVIRVHPEFSYGDTRYARHLLQEEESLGAGDRWNVGSWNQFYWTARLVHNPSINIRGSGTNLTIVVYSKSKIDQGHRVDGIIVHYIPRRLQR